MSFSEELENRVNMVNGLMEGALSANAGEAEYLNEAMRYSVMGNGKRIRPILMFETSKLFSRKPVEIPEFMIAIELIHSYSLVHDDMPCLDNDEYRRGRKTTHAQYGEPTALLVGDGLLNLAYEEVSMALECSKSPKLAAQAFSVLARCAGLFGMVGGQAADVRVEKEKEKLTKEKLMYIHENKTGALIVASLVIGGILGGAKQKDIEKLSTAAMDIGLAFQIRDDILDVEGNFEEFGKPIGSDAENGKETYVTLFGMEQAKADARKYSDEALNILKSFKKRNLFLEELVESMVLRTR